MTRLSYSILASALSLVTGVGIALDWSNSETSSISVVPAAHAAGGVVKSRTGEAPDRYVYYPGTEELKADEFRLQGGNYE